MKDKLKKIIKKIVFGNKIVTLYNNHKEELFNLKYEHLLYLSEKNIDKFKEIKNYIETTNLNNLKNKSSIKIGFVLFTASNWSCDSLYKMLLRNDRFNPYIIVCKNVDENQDLSEKNYRSTFNYFKNNNYQVIDINEVNINDFDIVFYMTPFTISPKEFNIKKLKLNTLTVYVTYSFMIASRDWKYNIPMYKLVWKFFADSLIYKELIGKYCTTGNDNVVFCGYTRMDELIDNSNNIDDTTIWKIPKSNKRIYKIIYAPHHSVFDEKAGFSTFDLNYKFMLELAKKYSDTTSWIVKPHPQLGARIVKNAFFNSIEEYDKYLNEWNSLPNAKVVTEGTYFDIFKTSDTMILDSVSFLVEYQYIHKPLLFLTRDSQKFNEFGDKVKDIIYKVDGSDFSGIEKYLNDVVLSGNDYMKKEREDFFEENLNYVKYNNGRNASSYIYDYLNDLISIKDDSNERK